MVIRSGSASWPRLLLVATALAAACRGGAPSPPPAPGSTAASTAAAREEEPALRFLRRGEPVARFTRSQLEALSPPRVVKVFDPLYQRDKRYRALAIAPIIEKAYGIQVASEDWLLRAQDGFAVFLAGATLAEDGALLAEADADGPWEPMPPERKSPAPFYLIWEHPNQQSTDTHPRPFQLESFDVAKFEERFGHTIPPSPDAGGSDAVQRGFALFRVRCLVCHAINQEGGHAGPELNVPQNITEYRPAAQIRAYIRNPLTFRYGNMPPHPDLTDANLDDLLAYLGEMARHKHDPARGRSQETK